MKKFLIIIHSRNRLNEIIYEAVIVDKYSKENFEKALKIYPENSEEYFGEECFFFNKENVEIIDIDEKTVEILSKFRYLFNDLTRFYEFILNNEDFEEE